MEDSNENSNVLNLAFCSKEHAKKIIKELTENTGNVRFSTHAIERMRERSISDIQIIRCLINGYFKEEPYRGSKGNWQFTVEASDSGRIITVAAALDRDSRGNYIIVITTF